MAANLDLVITRDITAPREKLYRCWTEPELIKQWFAPKPFAEGWGLCTTQLAELAARL